MKILFFTYNLYYGGAETKLRWLANGMAARGHDVTIATNQSAEAFGEFVGKSDIDERIKIVRPVYVYSNKRGRLLYPLICLEYLRFSARNIRKLVAEVAPDVIVTFLTEMNVMVRLSTLGMDVPVVVSERNTIVSYFNPWIRLQRKVAYPRASAVTVLTKKDLGRWYSHKNVVYMPNPAKVSDDTTSAKRKKVVLAAGRIDGWKQKGFDNLLRVWAKVCHQHPDWTLEIAGRDADGCRKMLTDMACDLGCINVEFLGQVKGLSNYMRDVEIFVLSSREEGFPGVLAEAMDAECCCVAFDCNTGPGEMIHDDESGILVPDGDIDAMAAALDKAMGDEALRRELASNTRRSLAPYDPTLMLDRWERLITDVAQRRSIVGYRQ